jgi:hypothetical protein
MEAKSDPSYHGTRYMKINKRLMCMRETRICVPFLRRRWLYIACIIRRIHRTSNATRDSPKLPNPSSILDTEHERDMVGGIDLLSGMSILGFLANGQMPKGIYESTNCLLCTLTSDI